MILRCVIAALSAGNDVISASLRSTTIKVNIADPASIRQMYRSAGNLHTVVCTAGQAKFAPLAQLSDADFHLVDLNLQSTRVAEAAVVAAPPEKLRRDSCLYVRLRPQDHLILRERAAGRSMAAATYASSVLRAHLRAAAPTVRLVSRRVRRVNLRTN